MQYLLIKMDSNWADEFDVNAFWITTDEEFEDWKDILSKCYISDGFEIYFGTNEFISFSSYEDIIESLTIVELEESFALNLIDLFGHIYGLIDLEELPNHYEYDEDLIEKEDEDE